jgi:hypothetical protein
MTQHDTLDDVLNAASPRISPRTTELDDEIRRMSLRAARSSRAGWREFRRPAAIALAGALVVGGGLTAAADTLWEWHPWALTPDATFEVTYPSGIMCEMRLGNVRGVSEETNSAIREFVAENDLIALADVEGQIEKARAAGQTRYDSEGVLQPAGPGTPMYNEDFEYQMALGWAIHDVITDHLRSEGILAPGEYSESGYAMQGDCSGSGE